MSLGVDAEGKRIRRRVTAATKTAVLEAMAELREELGRAPRSSRKYTVNVAVAEWLEGGLPGRSERTKKAYKEALAPLLAKIGHRPLRELTAMEVRNGLESLASGYSTRYLQIAHSSLERAIRFGQIHQRVSGNVAELIAAWPSLTPGPNHPSDPVADTGNAVQARRKASTASTRLLSCGVSASPSLSKIRPILPSTVRPDFEQ